jgi:uncharacterized LabA/DUF88 family protein
LFIDGGCFRSTVRNISKDLFGNPEAYLPLVSALAAGQFQKVFYYDAVSGIDYGESDAAYEKRVQPEHDRLALIQALDRVHVAKGQIVGSKTNRRQKGVDVRLAVDMMTYAFRGTISRVTLFAGDADFVPLLQALVREGLHVTLWHPPQANAELKGAADSVRPFTFKVDHLCFSTDGIKSAFQGMSSGSGLQPADNLPKILLNGFFYAGSWSDEILTVWKAELNSTWHYMNMKAPGATLDRALRAFELLHEWGIPGPDSSWVVS